MARKKTQHQSFMTVELQNILAGGILIVLGVLMFLSTKETSVIGQYFAIAGGKLFSPEGYRWIFPPITVALGTMILVKKASWSSTRFIGLFIYFIATTSLVGLWKDKTIGIFDLHKNMVTFLGQSAAVLTLIVLFFASLYMTLRISYRTILSKVRDRVPSLSTMREVVLPSSEEEDEVPKKVKGDNPYKKKAEELEKKLADLHKAKEKREEKVPLSGKAIISNAFSGLTKKVPLETIDGKVIESKTPAKAVDFGTWDFPSVKLLNEIEHKNTVSPDEIEEKSILIQKTFLQFGIDVEMEEECVGPTVIQYRLRPSEGVRLSKIESLKKDLTLALKAKSIRIQAPIPGLGLVGIEVPNEKRDIVGIKEVLTDDTFRHHKSKLALAIGKDINGDFIVGDLAKMPHLLIAGQTGSGKSVGMNGFILSMLYKNTPSELRMIMVDPKQVELGIYDGIPHLLTPVINSPDKALNALKWGVAEMERRYSTMKPMNVRNLEEYNAKVGNKDRMPVIVIIIDELADLMMSGNKKEVEAAITRIAQKARAVGLHLILATQRPSVDVITGLIKANVPSRVAFTVASNIDSRTILDQIGAEDLLGRGDMLYFPTGAMATTRIQGVLVETDEVERVVNHIKRTIDPAMLEDIYDHSIIEGDRGNWEGSVGGDNSGNSNFEEDPKIIEEAIELVRNAGKCSTSMLQRHLKLGYGRAARVVDILENLGIVGPADGSKPREVIG
ncbi:MAG: DNA translocase FtsK [Candidatus Gracilibacteria bacterium]|nr:DNA translocase FtsK [Candidatus Gracilibacteria bacterium]